jgi:hypothetical protein
LKGIRSPPAPRSAAAVDGRIAVDYALNDGDSLRRRSNKLASGRFGVTTEYLVSADRIRSMAQGAKPDQEQSIARQQVSGVPSASCTRCPASAVSPPPLHDILFDRGFGPADPFENSKPRV